MNRRSGSLAGYMAPAVLVALVALAAVLVPNFLSEVNLNAILFQYSIIGLLALGQLCVILTGGIDLSQGSMLAFTSILTAVLYNKIGLVGAVACGLLAPMLLGGFCGLLASRTAMPPFVITLGMQSIARALAMLVAGAKPVPLKHEGFSMLAKGTFLRVPVCAILWLAVGLLLHYLLTRRRYGRHIFAVGSSEQSAVLSGVNVVAVKQGVYVISALFTAVAALIWTARLGSGSPIGGNGYEMEAIASVVVGGGSLMGGVGSVLGAMTGALVFGVINSILNLVGISPFLQGTIKGIIILLAVVAVQFQKKSGQG